MHASSHSGGHFLADGSVACAQVRVSEYNQLKGQVNALNRKATGNLAVRDLAGLVPKDDCVATENLVTLFAVVSKSARNEWLGCYEQLSDFVVRFKGADSLHFPMQRAHR